MTIRFNEPGTRKAPGLIRALFASLVLAGCGGGGGGDSSGGTASAFASGAITGFGSVIVNGVRFDDSSAAISDDDGNVRHESDLRLGMMAEIESGAIGSDDNGQHGTARTIRVGSEIIGPVDSIASDGSTLVVLGETVAVNSTTMFDDSLAGGLAGLVAGTSIVEVHGLLDTSTGTYTATRIEPKTAPLFFKLRGLVSALDTTAHTFKIGSGSATISYATIAASVPAGFANGQLVRVKLQTTQSGGQWIATAIDGAQRTLGDHDEAELEGKITASTFATDKKFSVNGIAVDASNATFPDGTAGIVLGATVEVQGSAVNGVVVATRVKLEDAQHREAEGFELHGALSALDTTAQTFLLRGVTVSYAGSGIEFRKGTVADLANGRNVEVKGTRAASGTTLQATRITFE